MTHAAQIAFSFFTHVANENERKRMWNTCPLQDFGDSQHGCNAGAIVGNPGPIQPGSLLAHIQWRGRRKHGVDVSAERNVAIAVSGMDTKNVADLVGLNFREANFAEALN